MVKHFRKFIFYSNHIRLPILFGVFVVLAVTAAAFALEEERLIHIFPTNVESDNWMKGELAMEQTLGSQAVFSDFTRENASFVIVTPEPVIDLETESDLEHAVSEGDVERNVGLEQSVDLDSSINVEDDVLEQHDVESENVDNSTVEPLSDVTFLNYLKDTALLFFKAPAFAEEVEQVEIPVEHETTEIFVSEEEFTTTSEDVVEEKTTEEGAIEEQVIVDSDIEEEPEGQSTTLSEDDIRVCSVLQTKCHTIEFSGFDIGSMLSEHAVKSYTLNLSLGAKTLDEVFTPDKLFVRYFYEGSWHLAGEIQIQGELSNFDNGGHFSFPLPDLVSWDALKHFRVEIEFVQHNDVRTEVFLDSVWVDTVYEVESLNEEIPLAPNIVAQLVELEDSNRPDILLTEEERVTLNATDSIPGDDLMIRSNLDVYNGLTTARAYISVTNTSDREERFRFITRTGNNAKVARLEERMKNVPVEQDTSSYSEVAYFCERGWELEMTKTPDREDFETVHEYNESLEKVEESTTTQEVLENDFESSETNVLDGELSEGRDKLPPTDEEDIVEDGDMATTTSSSLEDEGIEMEYTSELLKTYTCPTTGEVETCNAFNADKTNCIVGNERIQVDVTTAYEDGWQEVDLLEVTDAGESADSFFERLFGGDNTEEELATLLTNIKEADADFSIMPKETRYFAVELEFEVQRAGEFVIDIEGEEANASRNMWWRSAYGHRMPITIDVGEGEEGDDVATLYDISLTRNEGDFFSFAALDGSDVRFYDPFSQQEIPARMYEYSYVDQFARFGVELEKDRRGTTTIYAYFNNEHVLEHTRLLAPKNTETPVSHGSLKEPINGAVLTIQSLSSHNYFAIDDAQSNALTTVGQNIFVDSGVTMNAQGPLRVAISDAEYRAGVHTLAFTQEEYVHVFEQNNADGRTVYDIARYREQIASTTFGGVEVLPLPAVNVFEPTVLENIFDRVNYLRDLRAPQFHDFREALKDFALGDDITFSLAYRPQKGKFSRFWNGLFHDQLASVQEVHLLRDGELVEGARFEVVYGIEGEWNLHLLEMPRELIPGKYTLVLTVDEVGTLYTDSFDFYWGVLVVNTPQSVYGRDELVQFYMAALDDKGDTICDATLRLNIVTPQGEAQEIQVEPQGTCGANNVTDDPDYLAWYRPYDVGIYSVTLTHVNLDGEVVHQIVDSFEVREQQSFIIERRGATRIWPKASYTMELAVTAVADFSGTFVEAIPSDFELIDVGGAETTLWGRAKRLVWNIDLKAGETQVFRYEYDAPDVSPYVYLLGPAEIRVGEDTLFKEIRTWKLASDALGKYVEKFVTVTPTTADAWTTIDLSGAPYSIPANAVIEMALINTNYGGELYAGVRHASSTNNRRFLLHEAETTGTGIEGMTEVTVHVTASATSSIQYYADDTSLVTFRILGYWTDGVYVERFDTTDAITVNDTWTNWDLNTYGLTEGDVAEVVMINNNGGADFLAGVRTDGSSLDRYIRIHEAESGGDSFATMFVQATTSTARVEAYSDDYGPGVGTDVDFLVAGYWDTMPTGLTYKESWSDLGGPTANTTWTDRRLDDVSVPPTGIAEIVFDNNNDTNGAMEIGVRTNGSSLGRVLDLHEAEGAGAGVTPTRMLVTAGNDASSTIEYYTESTTDDNFYLAGYWSADNYPPDTPILYDIPFDNEKTGSSTPYFEFSALDPDGASDLIYQIQWDDDADVASSPLGDRTSDDESGCTPNCFENSINSGDTSPFTEGEKVRFTIQSELTTGTTYYWRVRAKDGAGGIYGEWSDVLSVTYVVDTDPKGWIQTEDTQFDQGTLVGVETYGANKVRLATTPPQGAMVAYGSDTNTTPHYRLWNGSAWSASSSAQSVGGQISWTVVRASPTRNEYVLATQDTGGDVNVQVYNGSTGTWGNLWEVTPAVGNAAYKGFDVQYQSQSGNAVIAYCDGNQDPSYAMWNGTSWSATSTIDLAFTQNCEWLSLAASPVNDELVMVARANVAQTNHDYEVQVYDSTSGVWGNSYTGGVGSEAALEGIAVMYEESGTNAIIAVSNGGNANAVYNYWDGTAWGVEGTVALGDDFEWGQLAQDDGTDNLALCYIDEANDMGTVFWNGTTNTWGTYREHDTAGDNGISDTDAHGRPISCQYETTAGRDGYHMVPYSNTSNAEYNYYNGSAWQYTVDNGASISSIQDSWTVNTARTGVGNILAVFHDNENTRYDFSAWDGSSWTTMTTLDDYPSRTTEPWYEPITIAAQLFQDSVGSITSTIVDFDLVPNRPTWGEVIWNTTEPTGTDVKMQVYYATTTAQCNVLVPDAVLSGNSTGFDATESPLDLSGLSTSTYNMLCIKTTLSSTNAETPTLDDWSLLWERQPYLTQESYRWYTNVNLYTPTDPWPYDATDLGENTPIGATDLPPKPTDVLRLRMSLKDENASLPAGEKAFKLQYAEGLSCNADLNWNDVAPIGSTTALWRGYENTIESTWYDENWSNRIAVTIEEEYVDDVLAGFPVYVNLADFDATFWATVNGDGGDIRVTEGDGETEVPREVVFASTTTETGELHFRATTISSSTDTTYYIYYGNSSASDYASTSPYGAQQVWSNGYVGVWHLNNGADTATRIHDSTSGNYIGQKGTTSAAPTQMSGKVGYAQYCDGGDYIDFGDVLDVGTSDFAIDLWYMPTIVGSATNGILYNKENLYEAAGGGNEYRYAWQPYWNWGVNPNFTTSVNNWYHAVTTFNQSSQVVFKNGAQVYSRSQTGSIGSNSARLQFCARGDTGHSSLFTGYIDEVRMSTTTRSAAWWNATYQNATGTLVTILGSETLGDGSTLPSTVLSSSDVAESYEEENNSISNPHAIATGEEGEWDWVIENNGAQAGTGYCFRMIGSDGVPVQEYTRYPQLITNAKPNTPTNESPFDNIATASTTPWFEFVGTDPEENDVHYEIQIDDDVAFGSPLVDRNSLDHFNEFKNTVTISDKSPFTNSQTIRFIPTTSLNNGTTYWWRVRTSDPTGSNTWGEWSSPTSLTVNTSLVVTTWYQTTFDQFDTDTHVNTEPTGNDVALTVGYTSGTTTSPTIRFDWGVQGNAWGSLSWNDTETASSIQYHLEYNNNGVWELIPDSTLSGNALGFGTSPVSLLGLDPSVYSEIRIRANLTDLGSSPVLSDWTVSWGYAVEQPTLITLFDNEKADTTTPSYTFYSIDPQGDDLIYEIQWSSTPLYTSSTTRSSDVHSGFVNTEDGGDTSPFTQGDTIRYTTQGGDALTNGSTYWWHVRARDPSGENMWSVWSPSQSFTVDAAITVSTWYQTTDEQFETDTLSSLESSGAGGLQITTVSREVLVAYAEGLVQTPRYRIWNGTTWGSEKSAQNIGERIYWLQTDASPTRDEYTMMTMGISGLVTAQVYTASTQLWGNYTTVAPSSSNVLYRGFDLAYETTRGDLMTVSCSGSDAVYKTWNGTSWSATSTINLSFTNNCEWVQLASNPTSNEIILLARANIAETPSDYEAVVWNGSSWGNSYRIGSSAAAGYEAMAVEYEESGGNGIVVVGNGANNNFLAINWNGSSWTGTSTVAIGNDLNKALLKRDVGTDNILLAYVDANQDAGFAEWDGSTWTNYGVVNASANTRTTNVISAEYETEGSRDGDVVFIYGDSGTTIEHYQTWDHSSLSGEGDVSTLGESPVVVTTRTGDGLVLAINYDDDATEYDFSYWNGSSWSAEQVIETTSITNTNPRTEPISIIARRYPSFTSGMVISSTIDFYDGTGPGWNALSWNDTTPGSSDITYQVQYSTDSGESWSLVPDSVLSGNSTGNTTGPVSLANLPYTTYNLIRLVGNFTCNAGDCPTLSDWTVDWAEGLTVSGTAQQYDFSTNVDSGTVAVAVDGVVQTGKTGTISGGVWSIPNVTFFPGQVVEVWISGADDQHEAVAVATAVGPGNLTEMKLYERHLSIGSSMATTTNNVDLALYDYSVSANEDIFFDVDGGNDVTICSVGDCTDAGLVIVSGHTYRPDSTNAGNVTTHDIRIDGTFIADGNTIYISGSWDNNATSTANTSTVVFTATTTSEMIDSTGATLSSFNNVTFGQTSGTATWTLGSDFDVDGATNLSYGTLVASTSSLFLAGNLTLGTGGTFTKGTGTTTFDGTGISTITDAHSTKQDLGNMYLNGTSKTVRLASTATTTNITIATGNTFDVTSNNYAFEVQGTFSNAGTFSGQNGVLFFTATTTGKIINPGPSSFAYVVFDGVGGNWAFQTTNVIVLRDLTIYNGIVTFPTGILSIGQSLTVVGGQFIHNNGEVRMTSTAVGRTVTPYISPFYSLNFFGSGGSWSFGQTNATTSGNFTVSLGTVTLPTGILYVAGDFENEAGSIVHNDGLVHIHTIDTQKYLKLSNSTLNDVLFTGSSIGASSWYDVAWGNRVPITVASGKVSETLTDFPVYIDLNTLDEHFWDTVASDGGDIRVTAGDGTTELPIELVYIATSTHKGELYFKANSIASTADTTFYVYYGNISASGYASTSSYGARAVWSNGYAGVWHMQNALTTTISDSAYGNYTGTKGGGSAASTQVASPIGYAQSCDGSDYIDFGDVLDFGSSNATVETWFKPNAVGASNGSILYNKENYYEASAGGGYFTYAWLPHWAWDGGSTFTISVGTWMHSAVTYDHVNQTVYKNGTQVYQRAQTGDIGNSTTRLQFCARGDTGHSSFFTGEIDEMRFSTSSRSAGWLDATYDNAVAGSTFLATSTHESMASRVFFDTNAMINGDVTIETGFVTFPTGTLTLRGSLQNDASFSANSGTVLFATSSTGHTIDVGESSFYDVQFNNVSGGWTLIDHATSTHDWSIIDATSFTVQSGKSLAIGGTFVNSDPSATDWTGSTLSLYSGTTYAVGNKTQVEESYENLHIGANTDVQLWQSSATAYSVDGTGSLYSQDHAGVDGDLYIWGNYGRTSGTEYWSYTTDFDGTDISGSPRQVDVRFASGSSASLTGATLLMYGGSSASTTLANQGSGTYTLSLSSSTINARYFEMTNMDTQGLSLMSSTTVTGIEDGSFILTTNGGTMMTVSSSTIDTNPTVQVQRISFATSSGISSGYNVTATGTATSYWWFRNSSGNYSGENYDNDPTGNPGSVRWDDSGYTISVSGTVYVGEGTDGAPGVCDGTTPVVRLMVNGTTPYTTTCAAGSGTFTFPSVSFSGDPVLTAYLNTNGGARAVTVTRTPSGNMTGFDLYQNRLIVRHEGTDPLSITQLSAFDSTDDSDVPFVATTTNNTLTVESDNALYVWSNKTFVPGGNVTLLGGASGLVYDGTLRLAASSTFTAVGTESHSIGGSFIANTNATFTPASSTVTFTATSSGKTIAPSSAFYNLVFSGTGGGWTIASSTTVGNNLTISSGTISGTANIDVQYGAMSGDGVVNMTGGTVTVQKGGTFGGSNMWTFNNLTLGDGTTNTTTKNGAGNISVTGVLTISALHTLDAGSVTWTLTGSGSVFVMSGTFTSNNSTITFAGTSAMTIPALSYYDLVLAPANAGDPIYTLSSGTLSAHNVTVGNGTHSVTVNAITNDPLISVSDDVHIYGNATYSASDTNDLQIGGSYTNGGTFTGNGGGVVFNSTDVGESITPGNSSFHHFTVNGVGGGWTLYGNATTTGNCTLTNGSSFTKESGTTLSVQGIFTNAIGGAGTEWSGTTLYLNSGTSYVINTKSGNGDAYDTLYVGANTDISMWNSDASTYNVTSSGSLYSQDHAGNDGDLYIWGDYVRGSGSEYWSYNTDFDGSDISATPRTVAVYMASGATMTLSGGSLEILGASNATTTISNQGSGTYALQVTGGTLNAQYYRIRNISSQGLTLSGTPTITNLSNGDYELAVSGGSMITVTGGVIDANPVKLFSNITFATSSGVTSGYNVTATGVSVSSWRFIPGTGNYYGESFDSDPGGNPGYIIFSDSDDNVTISGNVYSDEGTTVSSICNGSSQVVALVLQGGTPRTTSCAAGTGYYEFTNVTGYAPGDTVTVFIDGVSQKGAHVTRDIITSIADMHLYENRVIVRHEETTPISIASLAVYDSGDDADIPFTATVGSPSSFTTPANTKLIVWSGKTFTPEGNVTLTSGGTGTAYDGTLELQTNATLVASSTSAEAFSIGGSWLTGTGAAFTAGSSTVTFVATTSGKTISPNTSPFNTLTFSGSGGSWTFEDGAATTTNDFTISAGTVTFGSSTLAIGGSFVNSGVMSSASTSIRFSSSDAETVTFGGCAVGSIVFAGNGTHTMTDTNATSTGSVSITSGSVVLPSGTFSIADSFVANGGTFTHAGTLRMYGSISAQSLHFGTSRANNLTIAGSGSWAFVDTYATTTGTTTIQAGALTAPANMLSVGGSFINNGIFNSNAGHLYLYATTTGQQISASSSILSIVTVNGAGGGWTLTGNATTTGAWRLIQGNSFTVASSTQLEVQGVFENRIGGTATDWTDSILYLNASGTSYTINTKTTGGDAYAYLTLGANTDVRMWDSSGATTTVHASSSLYSMDHGAVSGDLYIWGEYARSSGSDYWSYATDFDGIALGGAPRQVDVRIASSSSISYTNSTLQMVGVSGATTTVAVINTGGYGLSVSGGTFNAQYYNVRNIASTGLILRDSVTVTSLSYGDFDLDVDSGTLLSVDADTLDQNPSKQITNVRFGKNVTSGVNVLMNGSSANYWDFTAHYGGFDGESYDSDGADACGSIRWDNSTCLEISQAHYRFRADDGGEGVPTNEWFDADWTYRKRITINNSNTTALNNYPVRIQVPYVSEMLSNYDDLRFTDASGTTSIPYFIESYTTATATVWVKVSDIPAQSSGSIFMYYNNDFAANAESGDNTFTFFDDFEDDNIAEYSGDTSYFDVVADSGAEGSYILKAESSRVDDFTSDGIYQTSSTFGQGNTVRFMQYINGSYDDEPCTLFAIQNPGSNNQNYGVCLDQYPSDKLILAKNVSSNDASGSVLASSTATWSSGWYTVEVDWKTTNIISASVYNSSGTLVATTSVTDSSYTSGGTGFSFWGQHGGWDFYTAYPYIASDPTYSFGNAQGGGGASWLEDQDTAISRDLDTSFRVRMSVENSGPQLTSQQFRIQYAPKTGYSTCAAVPSVSYNDVPNASGCGTNDICMIASPQFADQSATTQHLDTTSSLTFTSGYMVESPSNQGTSMTMATSTLTEVEYAVELTSFANDSGYCLRTTNGGVELDSYGQIAEVMVNGTPVVTEWSLNSGEPIVLIEGQTTTVHATGTIADLNGWEDILYATTTIYRSGVGSECSEDENNCYRVSSLSCPLNNCSGNTCDVECGAEIQYFADATDEVSVYASEEWVADLYMVDFSNNVATATAQAELLTMWGMSLVTSEIDYGALGVGEDTQDQNAISVVQNSGNTSIDIEIEGTDMTGGISSQIPASNQKFATSSFTYSSCVICNALSGTASALEVDLPKPTSTSSPVTDTLYWGVYVPTGAEGADHYGHNTFYAIGD